MTDHNDEGNLRGSTPIYTAKDVLVSLDRKIGDLDSKVDIMSVAIQIMASQNLNDRMGTIESEGSKSSREALRLASENRLTIQQHQALVNRFEGAGILIRALVGLNIATLSGVAIALVKAFGIHL